MLKRIRKMETYEKIILGICGSFVLLMFFLILINALKF